MYMNRIDKDLFKNLNILYVEDDEMTSEEVSFFLKRYVKNLFIAKNGQEGLELFKKNHIDIVITDVQMPVMNGLEMSKEILSIKPNFPIIVTTAYSDAEFLIDSIEMGIEKYILKPVNLLELLVLVQKSLHLSCANPKHYEDYIQFILDSNNSFMFILNSDKIEYVNKNLLELVGENSLKSLNEKFDEYRELFQLENVDTNLNYIDYIVKNPNNTYLVTLNKKNVENNTKKRFYVKYKFFEEMNKSVFLFSELKIDKLQELKNMVRSLDSDSLSKECIELLEQINKLVKIA